MKITILFGGDFPDAITTPLGDTEACKESCVLAHNINDVVGYNLMALQVILSMGLFIIIRYLEPIHWTVLTGGYRNENNKG